MRLATVVATGVALLALTACSGVVQVAVPPLATAPACAQIAWPHTVAGQRGGPAVPANAATHAWGSPAIIARCGVPAPPPTTLECLGVDEVDWIIEPLSDGTRFTTYGREPALQVLVPDAYEPAPMVLGDLTPAATSLPATGRRCR
ncbi:hypothetical protein BJY21_000667 [Kineosphaera limosa]|uniref:DUF3515 family protein n=1 Tax=Kineosphaera limosa NBRC 100340 TaxID=1184609 RepID=K6X0W7_9MICO|nr:DUF3515 family protein [Kineosphaera limosa]NYD99482.1 hypothetical protein [Kineosphaera limosa]GAB98017.1 hypothetical protein KILIM_094_00180 [Kineosphaera limosa NBRC 100340]